MSRTRSLALAVVAAASLALTACGGGAASEVAQSTGPGAESSAAGSSSAPAPGESSESATPSEDSSTPEPAEGNATDFCGAFEELDNVGDAASNPEAAEVFRSAAAGMKKYAPAEISTEANAYADAIAALADTIDGSAGGLSAQQAFGEVLAQSTDEIVVLAQYVGENC